MREIASRNNPETILAASLQTKKGRSETGLFPAEGEKLFLEAAKPSNRDKIDRVYLSQAGAVRYLPLVAHTLGEDFVTSDRTVVFSEPAFQKISSEKSPQGVITVLKSIDFSKIYIKIDKKDVSDLSLRKMIAFAGVCDPGNLGAVVRSAVAFGFTDVVLSADCVEFTNPKTVRAAMGGIFAVKFHVVEDLSSFVTGLRDTGRRVFAAELRDGAKPIGDVGLTSSDVVVIGNEGQGVPPDVSRVCDASVYIPISSAAESLNAAVAASLFLFEQSKSGN
ncbi:MAG: RNA methyltransferase [Clostridia bacterium]|nr:RNA methyltransferase [Clostridia bacterium]